MKLLLPIWVMLYVFQPAPQAVVDNDDLIPALTDDGVNIYINCFFSLSGRSPGVGVGGGIAVSKMLKFIR